MGYQSFAEVVADGGPRRGALTASWKMGESCNL